MVRQLELDLPGFTAALQRQDWPAMAEDRNEAQRLGATAAPMVFLNGKAEFARSLAEFRARLGGWPWRAGVCSTR